MEKEMIQVETDEVRLKAPQCRKDILDIMKRYGYYDKVMSMPSNLDRVKEFLMLLEDPESTRIIHDNTGFIPNPRIFPLFPGIKNKFTHDRKDYPWIENFEKNYQIIKNEALALDGQKDFLDYGGRYIPKGQWLLHILSFKGVDIEENSRLCKQTVGLLNQLPRRCQIYPWGDAVFSALYPGAHIDAHCSFDNLRLRGMLGVEVPEGCEMRVGNVMTRWEEGKVLFFEDSFEHEVWHKGDSRRIVLIFDLWHPDLTDIEIEALTIGLGHPLVLQVIYDALRRSSEQYNDYLTRALQSKKLPPNYHDYWTKNHNELRLQCS